MDLAGKRTRGSSILSTDRSMRLYLLLPALFVSERPPLTCIVLILTYSYMSMNHDHGVRDIRSPVPILWCIDIRRAITTLLRDNHDFLLVHSTTSPINGDAMRSIGGHHRRLIAIISIQSASGVIILQQRCRRPDDRQWQGQ